MTKAEIVQNLLDAHQITAEQAVVLLSPDAEKIQYVFIPQQPQLNWPWSVPVAPLYPTYLTPTC